MTDQVTKGDESSRESLLITSKIHLQPITLLWGAGISGGMSSAKASQERGFDREPMTYGIALELNHCNQTRGNDGDCWLKLKRPLPLIDECVDSHYQAFQRAFHREWLHERGRKLRELFRFLGWAWLVGVVVVLPQLGRKMVCRPLWDVVGAGQRTGREYLSWRTARSLQPTCGPIIGWVRSQAVARKWFVCRLLSWTQRVHFLLWLQRQSPGRDVIGKSYKIQELPCRVPSKVDVYQLIGSAAHLIKTEWIQRKKNKAECRPSKNWDGCGDYLNIMPGSQTHKQKWQK